MNYIAWGYYINWLGHTKSLMADSSSTWPWASVYVHCNTPRCHDGSKMTKIGQKVGDGPIPGNPHSFLKTPGYSFHSLAYVISHPCKNWQSYTLVPLLPSEMAHTLSMECVSFLNKPSLPLLWFALAFFPARSQKATLGGHPRAWTWPGMWPSSCTLLFPATILRRVILGLHLRQLGEVEI